MFRVAGVAEAAETVEWVEGNLEALREAAESTTSHGELLGVEPYVVGDSVYLRFAYDTKDAMGMNMATIATGEACEVVERETPADLVALSGNLCSDKKPAAINAVEGRGRSVTADVVIPGEIVEDRLHTTAEAIAEANTRKNLIGSAKAGSLGFNAHAANVVAAAFLATGQDEAQVVEGANAITTMDTRAPADGDENAPADLYASVSLASLEVGTVGGGTKLPTQSEALEILGVRGGANRPARTPTHSPRSSRWGTRRRTLLARGAGFQTPRERTRRPRPVDCTRRRDLVVSNQRKLFLCNRETDWL